MRDPSKRELRIEKRELKCAGSKLRRRELKRLLEESPEEAAPAEFDFGGLSSSRYNGLDHDSKRQKPSWKPTSSEE